MHFNLLGDIFSQIATPNELQVIPFDFDGRVFGNVGQGGANARAEIILFELEVDEALCALLKLRKLNFGLLVNFYRILYIF